jgi:hypothetical protein
MGQAAVTSKLPFSICFIRLETVIERKDCIMKIYSINYTIQASSNLLDWQPFTNFIITDSPYNFADPATTNFTRRYYRATRP